MITLRKQDGKVVEFDDVLALKEEMLAGFVTPHDQVLLFGEWHSASALAEMWNIDIVGDVYGISEKTPEKKQGDVFTPSFQEQFYRQELARLQRENSMKKQSELGLGYYLGILIFGLLFILIMACTKKDFPVGHALCVYVIINIIMALMIFGGMILVSI